MHNFAPPQPKLMHQGPDHKLRGVQVSRWLCKLACAAFCRSDFAPRPWFVANDVNHAFVLQVSDIQHFQLLQRTNGSGTESKLPPQGGSKHGNIIRSLRTHLVSVRGDRWRSHCVLH